MREMGKFSLDFYFLPADIYQPSVYIASQFETCVEVAHSFMLVRVRGADIKRSDVLHKRLVLRRSQQPDRERYLCREAD